MRRCQTNSRPTAACATRARRPSRCREGRPATGNDDTFVIQEHHARRLHYDFRLERNGVLVSWAVPKNLPETTSVNHLAVHTEDHPLEYATFEGSIPKGEYGGGEVIVWDSGTYETEKFRDNAPDGPEKGGEVIVTLHGAKISGRYALIQTDGKNWLAHRMKEQPTPTPTDMAPMLATHGSVEKLTSAVWAFEGKWDGYRLLVDADHGALELRSRSGRDVTREYPATRRRWPPIWPTTTSCSTVRSSRSTSPGCRTSARCRTAPGRPASSSGRSTCCRSTVDRCCAPSTPTVASMLETLADGGGLIVPEQLPGDGPEALEYAREHRWEGVVAKKRDSTYQPGRRSQSWIKDKLWLTQEVVIGGWRAGEGGRTSGIGALLVGVPDGRRPALRGPGRHRVHRQGPRARSRRRWRRCTPTNHPSPQGFPVPMPRA